MTPVEHAKHAQAQMELNSDHDNADSGHQKYPSRIRPIYHCKADRVYMKFLSDLREATARNPPIANPHRASRPPPRRMPVTYTETNMKTSKKANAIEQEKRTAKAQRKRMKQQKKRQQIRASETTPTEAGGWKKNNCLMGLDQFVFCYSLTRPKFTFSRIPDVTSFMAELELNVIDQGNRELKFRGCGKEFSKKDAKRLCALSIVHQLYNAGLLPKFKPNTKLLRKDIEERIKANNGREGINVYEEESYRTNFSVKKEKPEEADEVIEYLKERFCRSNVEDSSSDIQLDELRVAAEIMPEMGEFIRHSLDGWLRSGKAAEKMLHGQLNTWFLRQPEITLRRYVSMQALVLDICKEFLRKKQQVNTDENKTNKTAPQCDAYQPQPQTPIDGEKQQPKPLKNVKQEPMEVE